LATLGQDKMFATGNFGIQQMIGVMLLPLGT